MSEIRAVFDANVLFSRTLTDAFLFPAQVGVLTPLWSSRIRDEWVRNLAVHLTKKKRDPQAAFRRADIMDEYFPESIVGEKAIAAALPFARTMSANNDGKPPENDLHVLATAIAGKADYLVTVNTRHFPRYSPDGARRIERIKPDEFLFRLISGNALGVIKGYRERIGETHRPGRAITMEGIISHMEGADMLPKSAKLLRVVLANPIGDPAF